MRLPIKTLVAILASTVVAASFAADATHSIRGTDPSVAEQEFAAKDYQGRKPGQQDKVARTFDGQPPVIPHAVDNFDEITLEENQCLSCHGPDVYKEKKAPKAGDSHFQDREGKKLADVSKLRYDCVLCHAPQSDAPPLVENTFKGQITPLKASKKN